MLIKILVVASLVVAMGILFAAVVRFVKIRKLLCSDIYENNPKYKALSAGYAVLIVFFLLVYAIYAVYWTRHPQFLPISYLVTALLFFGSIFVGASVLVIGYSLNVILGVKLNEIDSMTGLMSKNSFEIAVQSILDEGSGEYLLVVLDMDRFKQINDVHGHGKGDEAIRSIAHILRRSLRSSDLVGRFGGDEFLLLVPNVGRAQLDGVMERVEQAIISEQERLLDEVFGGISYGVAPISGGSGASYQARFTEADEELYAMKRQKSAASKAE